jgi:hypothetical protein
MVDPWRNYPKNTLWKRFFSLIRAFRIQKKTPRFILTVWQKSSLADNWTDLTGGFDAVSVKAVDGKDPYKFQDAAAMAAEAEAVGLDVHTWGFHYCASVKRAKSEAEAAVEACEKLNAKAYHWNAEKTWDASADPEKFAVAFAEAFKNMAPNVDLYANCFSSKVTSYMLESFDYYEPMIYGTRRTTIASKFSKRFSSPDIPNDKRCAMVGTGRKQKDNTRQAWGYLKAAKGSTGTNGLDALVKANKPASINFFRGGRIDGEDMMSESNSINPSLSDQIKHIKQYLKDGIGYA